MKNMIQMTGAKSYVQAVQALPLRLREEALSLSEGERARARKRIEEERENFPHSAGPDSTGLPHR